MISSKVISFNSDNARMIRAIACMGVFITHTGRYLTSNNLLSSYFSFGAEGVRAFFILSGFFMCCSAELSEGNVWGYYKKRTQKIIPIYYLVIIAYVILGKLNIYPWPIDTSKLYFTRYFFFISTSVPSNEEYWVNLGGTWTISYFVLSAGPYTI